MNTNIFARVLHENDQIVIATFSCSLVSSTGNVKAWNIAGWLNCYWSRNGAHWIALFSYWLVKYLDIWGGTIFLQIPLLVLFSTCSFTSCLLKLVHSIRKTLIKHFLRSWGEGECNELLYFSGNNPEMPTTRTRAHFMTAVCICSCGVVFANLAEKVIWRYDIGLHSKPCECK